jgi:hypothetical protein
VLKPADIWRLHPDEYEFLWRSILRQKHGAAYRRIDGHGIDCMVGDTAYQIYSHQTAAWATVQAKFREDLQSAQRALASGELAFDRWVFVSTFPFKEPAQAAWLRKKEAEALPLVVATWGDEDLLSDPARQEAVERMVGLIRDASAEGVHVKQAGILAIGQGAPGISAIGHGAPGILIQQGPERRIEAPRVIVAFADGTNVLTSRLASPRPRSAEERAAMVEEKKSQHPLLPLPTEQQVVHPTEEFAASLGAFHTQLRDAERKLRAMQMAMVGEEELGPEKYNAGLERYFSDYADWLDEVDEHAAMMARSVHLQLEVRNEGTAPANDVYITIKAGPGVLFYKEDDEDLWGSAEPELPKRSIRKPNAAFGIVEPPMMDYSSLTRPVFDLPDFHESTEITRDRVEVWSKKLKQGRAFAMVLPVIVLTWEGEPSPITLAYTVNADELPTEFSGELTVSPEIGPST